MLLVWFDSYSLFGGQAIFLELEKKLVKQGQKCSLVPHTAHIDCE